MLCIGVLFGSLGKFSSCNEKSFFHTGRAHHGTEKFLNLRLADGNIGVPTFSLDVNQIEAEFVLMYNTVNAVVTTGFCLEAIAVIHGFHQVNDKLLKKYRRLLHDFGKQVISQSIIDCFVKGIHLLFGSLRIRWCDACSVVCGIYIVSPVYERSERWIIALQKFVCDGDVTVKKCAPGCSDDVGASFG